MFWICNAYNYQSHFPITSLAAALKILEENHDLTELSKQARNRNHAGRQRHRIGRQRRQGRHVETVEKTPTQNQNRGRAQTRVNGNRNILQDEPILQPGTTERYNGKLL